MHGCSAVPTARIPRPFLTPSQTRPADIASQCTVRTVGASRSEITDAAMGERAECVMLNKAPHILDAMRMLDDILRRMESHQSKKRPLLRALRSCSLNNPVKAPVVTSDVDRERSRSSAK